MNTAPTIELTTTREIHSLALRLEQLGLKGSFLHRSAELLRGLHARALELEAENARLKIDREQSKGPRQE